MSAGVISCCLIALHDNACCREELLPHVCFKSHFFGRRWKFVLSLGVNHNELVVSLFSFQVSFAMWCLGSTIALSACGWPGRLIWQPLSSWSYL